MSPRPDGSGGASPTDAAPTPAHPRRIVHPSLATAFRAMDDAGIAWCLLRGEASVVDPLQRAESTVPSELLLLVWLRQIAANLTQEPRLAHNPVWVRRNVVSVLRAIDAHREVVGTTSV